MQHIAGIFFALFWLIYLGQLVSVVNLELARRLGLQEAPETVDALYIRDCAATARWDVASMWTLPLAGVLMLIDQSWWPSAALIGGAVFVDTGGRQAFKLAALRKEGVRVGTQNNVRLAFGVYALFVIAGGAAIVLALFDIAAA